MTADLSLDYFHELQRWLDELKLGHGGYGFVISSTGTFISDQNPEYLMRRRLAEFADPRSDERFAALLELTQRHETGCVKGVDFWSGEPSSFLIAPVPSSGWSFVAVIPDQSVYSSGK